MKFIGYSGVESFARNIEPGARVYLMLLEDHAIGSQGVGAMSCALTAQSTILDDVAYVRVIVARVQTVQGEPFDTGEARERTAAALEALRIVREWLTRRGFEVVEATIAAPRDLKYLEGQAECLRYDKARRTYIEAQS